MANVTLRSNALYCGPGTNYAGAATGVYGKSAEVLWKEDAYYCVRLSNPKVEGYISNRYVTIPSGTSVSTFTPPDDEIRYVNTSSSAYLGQGTTYETISQPERGQEVYYLGKKVGTLAYIEYTLHSSTKKYRAWFPHMSLSTAPVFTPGKYVTGNVIDNSGDEWYITRSWGHYEDHLGGHLAIDVRRVYGTGGFYGNDTMRGTDIYAIEDGTVVTSNDNTPAYGGTIEGGVSYGANGKCIVIEHKTAAGKKYYSSYCHLDSRIVSVGNKVKKNQVIGTMGSTGNVEVVGTARTVHLHLHITDDNAGEDAGSYKTGFHGATDYTDMYSQELGKNLRYYNPTKFFQNGESFIDNN